jgi:hypothetical protein
MKKLIIHEKKTSSKHNDSIWYDDLIAEMGEYKLYVLGIVRIYDEDGLVHDGWKERNNGFPFKFENDDDLKKIYDNDKYFWEHNNWFEIIHDKDEGEGIVEYGYDEGIKTLKELNK